MAGTAAQMSGRDAPPPVDPAREAAWAAAGARGDRAALRAIVEAHQDAVYRLLWRLSNGDRELSLDLAQDTFVRAFNALDAFRAGAPMRPWLFRIANNLFLDHVRKKKPESLDALAEGGEEAGYADPAIEALTEATDLGAALAQLPVAWRQALILRHDDDLSYEQIAEALGIPLGTAKTWLYRGRERLKALLGGKKEDEA